MRVLIVGGTGFLGGAIAQAAQQAGHDVTILARGVTPQTTELPMIKADRMALPALPAFDAVIDTCAYAPDMVTTLRAATPDAHYTMVSSISVYDALPQPNMDEATPASTASPEHLSLAAGIAPDRRADAGAYGQAYGPLKRACEIAAKNAAIVRLGLIVGPGDYTDRFTYWVRRMDMAGPVPVPAPMDRPVQVIDVRDAADFVLSLAERRRVETLNLTGKARPFGDILQRMAQVAGQTPDLHWRPLETFVDHGLNAWTDLPLILPSDTPKTHMMNVSIDRAVALGLSQRPLADTIRSTLDWDRARRATPLTAGMTPAAEARLLA